MQNLHGVLKLSQLELLLCGKRVLCEEACTAAMTPHALAGC